MMSLAMLQAAFGLLHTMLVVTLLCVLFRKAGLRGGVFLVAFLPLLGMVANAAIPMMLGVTDAPYAMILLISAVSAICYLTPLAVLAFARWPALVSASRGKGIFE